MRSNPFPVIIGTMSQAAERMLDVLDAIAVAETPLAVMEVASLTGLNKSTCSRLLALLASREYITREADTRRYRVGPTMLGLLATIGKRTELLRIVHPYLEAIRNESGETTSLHLRVGGERICIDAVDRFPPQLHIQPLGIRSPLHVGTSGRVVMAFMEPQELQLVLKHAAAAGLDPADLQSLLSQAREQGYLSDVSYKTDKHVTLSAPLFQGTQVFGAVTVTGLQERWSISVADGYAKQLRVHAETISSVITGARIFVYQEPTS